MQMARKGGTVSGPKSYGTPTAGDFKKVSYTLGRRGEIDFSMGTSAEPNGWKNPVATNSLVNLNDAKVQIKKGDRSQHFALGDKLYAEKNNLGKASDTTEMRRKKLTWHHLATKHNMVLVDMQVHRKHGHNGGVHLW